MHSGKGIREQAQGQKARTREKGTSKCAKDTKARVKLKGKRCTGKMVHGQRHGDKGSGVQGQGHRGESTGVSALVHDQMGKGMLTKAEWQGHRQELRS